MTAAQVFSRLVVFVRGHKDNLLITALCMTALACLDLAYSYLMNGAYVFRWPALASGPFWLTCFVILAITYTRGFIFWPLLVLIPILSIFQVVTFEYFGSYILPIHFIQLLPDFWLIMSELIDVIGEMAMILLLSAALLLIYFAVILRLSRTRQVQPRILILISALLFGDLIGNYVFITSNAGKLGEPSFKALFPGPDLLGAVNVYKSARYLVVGILPERILANELAFPALAEPQRVASPDANIILIINESVRAESLSLLGAAVQTTPKLAAVEGLYVSTIYSAGTMTRTSFAAIMNRLKYPGLAEQFLSQSNCLFRLAKQNGFQTHFFYAQGKAAADSLLPYMCSNEIDSVLAPTDAPQEFVAYDESLAYQLANIDFSQRNFVVIGLNGAHSPYDDKSPASFKKFVEEYDNAVHYSDHVIADLIATAQKYSTKPTYILITSDHGELLKGEDNKRGHGWFRGKVVKVPFLFLALNSQVPVEMGAKVDSVRSHFDMATLAIALMGYDVQIEDPNNREIFINGSDLFGLAGHLRLQISAGSLVAVEPFGGEPEQLKLDDFRLPLSLSGRAAHASP